MSIVSIDVPEDISEQLNKLAVDTGQSRSDYVLEIIAEHLGDLQDLQVVEERVARRHAGLSRSYSLEEVERSLGVAD